MRAAIILPSTSVGRELAAAEQPVGQPPFVRLLSPSRVLQSLLPLLLPPFVVRGVVSHPSVRSALNLCRSDRLVSSTHSAKECSSSGRYSSSLSPTEPKKEVPLRLIHLLG
ncbi:unnamed protein product [Heligmosomoides polygyrus]|uniref:Transmembrane protein n=1 Tax=Heligmosomoides polygyrus TaxID=6339 RepID=A0A183FEY7_HELPZ|nr:unnamed protein product [Heligmosomoides polygyrus]